MAITLKVKKGGGSGDFQPGWKKVTASKAAKGSLENGSQYMDVWFEGYPDNFNLRMYAKVSKAGEEFAIANLFRFAQNAGVTEVSDGTDKGESIVKIDDTPSNLVGKTFWIYLYKNEEGYSRVLQRIAPVEHEGTLDQFVENDVKYWKQRAEDYFTQWVQPNIGSSVVEKTDDVPF
jgi:hypothetical protein